MVDLVIVCSVTVQICFEKLLQKSLEIIGMSYKLILTDSNLSLSESYNSIIETNLEDVKQSKYLIFIAQDVSIKDQDWGRKLIEVCDSLSDFGYGGVECKRDIILASVLMGKTEKELTWKDCDIGFFSQGNNNDPSCEVTCCDGAIIIIPSWLFLEHQFDTQFFWYPIAEDYACWVRFVKKLKVYHVPIKDFRNGDCTIQSRHVSQFKTHEEYYRSLFEDKKKLLRKWNLEKLETTTG
jgi:hypothetical protein